MGEGRRRTLPDSVETPPNLLDNAATLRGAEGPSIRVGRDNGMGMAPKRLERTCDGGAR